MNNIIPKSTLKIIVTSVLNSKNTQRKFLKKWKMTYS